MQLGLVLVGGLVGGFLLTLGGFWLVVRWLVRRGGKAQGEGRLPTPELPGMRLMNYAWKVTDLTGQELEMSHFRDKLLFLNLWATWCPPCKAELPNLERLYAALHEVEGVEFAFITTEKPEALQKFLVDRPLNLPLYLASEIPAELAPGGVPTTWIVSQQGRILVRHSGAAAWDEAEGYLRSLLTGEEVVAEIPSEPMPTLVCAADGSDC